MSREDKRKVNCIFIEPATHSWLIEQANIAGESLGDYVGLLLDDVSSQWEPPTNEEPSRMLRWNLVRAQRRKRQVDDVFRLASIYNDLQEDDIADLLQEQCDLAGLDYAEVMREVGRDPFSTIVAHSRDGSKFGQCIRWLSKAMRDRSEPVPARTVIAAAAEEGFGNAMLQRAKRAINQDHTSPNIVSVKDGVGWTWVLEE
jgi:hypothetical protein